MDSRASRTWPGSPPPGTRPAWLGDRLRGADVRPIRLVHATLTVIQRNPAWAFGYNAAAGKRRAAWSGAVIGD